MIHLTDDQARALADAERAPLMHARSMRWCDKPCWVTSRLYDSRLEHDAYDVACCVRDGLLAVNTGGMLSITEIGRDALYCYRFDRRPIEVAA